jgi:hypothetical protein
MRHVIAPLLLLVSAAAPLTAADFDKAASAQPAVGACTLLTKDIVAKVTPYEKKQLALVLSIEPSEDALGKSGSACNYGGITMQIDPFSPAFLEKQRDKTWVAVAGVGDAAYYRDNRGEWGELYVRAGAHVLTIQMDVPTGRTAASIQSNTIALAKEILPKLK